MSKDTRADNRKRMRRLVEEWRSSGESAAAFARRHGLSGFKFQYWRDVVKGMRGGQRSFDSSFAPVRLLDTSPTEGATALEIRLASGDVIRCGREVPIESLSAVVRILGQRC
jgi:hypothetical protein